MDEEKQKEEEYRENMRVFFRRLQKAETLEECNEMLGEFESFEKRMQSSV